MEWHKFVSKKTILTTVWRVGWELGKWKQSGRSVVIHTKHEEMDKDGRNGGGGKDLCRFSAEPNGLHARGVSRPHSFSGWRILFRKLLVSGRQWHKPLWRPEIVAAIDFVVPAEKMPVLGAEAEESLSTVVLGTITLPRAHEQTNHIHDPKCLQNIPSTAHWDSAN